jgi:hypothetical protein
LPEIHVATEANNEANVATVSLACSQCGTSLPEGAQFCLKCGKPISIAKEAGEKSTGANKSDAAESSPEVQILPPVIPPKPPKRHIFRWVMLALFLFAVVWAATSDSFVAQGIQELAGWKHDQPILAAPFTVAAHTFRYYKFSLPEGSMNVSVVGEFTSSMDTRMDARGEKNPDSAADNDIEVFVLSEPAFAVWQNGYATSSVYESGRVEKGSLQSVLPPGAGVYYLVFSNKFATRTAKSVHASVSLRYKSWLPGWLRGTKERFWSWIGV